MTNLETDLLDALREMKHSSVYLTEGRLPSGAELERFHAAIHRADLVIERAEREERLTAGS